MPASKEDLLNEASLLSLRINEIYSTSLEIHKNLLKDGYHDTSIESIFNRAYTFKAQLEEIKKQLSLFQENNDIEDLATNDEDITRKDLDHIASQSDYSDESYQYESEDSNIGFLGNEDYQTTDIESSQNRYEENQEDDFQENDNETLDIEVTESFEEYENDFEDKYLEELPQELNEQEFNWDNFDDFDELDDIYEEPEKITKDGKLTREQRANQIAVEILKKYDWDDKYLSLLRETFEINRYPASRTAIERQLKNGMYPEELELALFIRELWASNGHYWLSFFSIYDKQTQRQNNSIGWKYPLQIIRSFTYLPSQDEIQFFIERAYDDWCSSTKLCEEFQSFILYLIYISEFKYEISEGYGFLTYNEVFVTCALKSSYWYW
jgi:hypothetical protein